MTAAGSTPLWICEFCKGPAVWTMFDGEPWFHCELECDGFRQLELFTPNGVHDNMRRQEPQDAGRLLPGKDEPESGLPF